MKKDQGDHYTWLLKKLGEKHQAEYKLVRRGSWEEFPTGRIYEIRFRRLVDRHGQPHEYEFTEFAYPSVYNLRELKAVMGTIRAILDIEGEI
jgi:hypothetical protein